MSLLDVENKFLDLIKEIKSEDDKLRFLQWISTNWKIDDLPVVKSDKAKILNQIADELRCQIPGDGILPTENIVMPSHGPNSDCNSATTVHLDEFLYNDEHVDDMVEEGKMSRYYCASCLSRNIKPLTFITHSMSAERIEFLFTSMLSPLDLEIVLDVGSRLGAVLYGAYLFTNSPKIIGVEINKEFCRLQDNIIKKYGYSDRIHVICDSIFNAMDVLTSADVVILNNVFEFFADVDTTVASWRKLARSIKKGAVIVTIPHLELTFSEIPIGFEWRDWVEELPLHNESSSINNETHTEQMQHYRVKQKITR